MGHTNSILCLKFNRDRKKLISGSEDCSIKIWDCVNLKCIRTLIGHTRSINCVDIF